MGFPSVSNSSYTPLCDPIPVERVSDQAGGGRGFYSLLCSHISPACVREREEAKREEKQTDVKMRWIGLTWLR